MHSALLPVHWCLCHFTQMHDVTFQTTTILNVHRREKLKSHRLHLFIQTYQITTCKHGALQTCNSHVTYFWTITRLSHRDRLGIISVCAHGMAHNLSQYHAVPPTHRDCLLISEHRADLSVKTVCNGSDSPVCLNEISYCRPSCSLGEPCLSSLGEGQLGKHLFPKLHLAWYQMNSG